MTEEVESAGAEPAYGKWPKEQLLTLVELEVETYEGKMALFGCNSAVMSMAHRIAVRTGASYPWLCQAIEDIVGGPRTA